MNTNYYIIGCGGVGSWLAPALRMLKPRDNLILVDGDDLEEKNLNRQLFTPEDIGSNKAAALGRKYGCSLALPSFYSTGLVNHRKSDWLLVCVDNHPARCAALQECDRAGCRVILAANETHSAEAHFYQPCWRGTKIDPRVRSPEMLEDRANDPRAAAAGCTGEAQAATPQLVSANMMAASLAMHLLVLWDTQAPKLSAETREALPYLFMANMTRLETHIVNQALK